MLAGIKSCKAEEYAPEATPTIITIAFAGIATEPDACVIVLNSCALVSERQATIDDRVNATIVFIVF